MAQTGRRGFIYTVFATVSAAIGVWFLYLAERFMLPPPEVAGTWQRVGPSSDFPLNQPQLVVYTGDAGFPDGVYVVRLSSGLRAYDVHCAHLQCTVLYTEGVGGSLGTFNCPCHGSVYTAATNKVIAGPAPHGLNYHRLRESGGYIYVGSWVAWSPQGPPSVQGAVRA